ncbi:hypothetical protein ACLBKU_11830 [Erythrobacter sp. NE805]|uniref:hypothetical protein n=1 Tax=Erythrobacter sp. NE805 TaxID=3389875 RepID=UPI00396B0ACD
MNAGQPLAHGAEPPRLGSRGGPLVMILVLFAGWGMLRMLWWEDPFSASAPAFAAPAAPAGIAPRSLASPLLLSGVPLPEAAYDPVAVGLPMPGAAYPQVAYAPPPPGYGQPGYAPPGYVLVPAPRPRRLVAYDPAPPIVLPGVSPYPSLPPGQPIRPEFLAHGEAGAVAVAAAPVLPSGIAAPRAPAEPPKKPRRWSLDTWAFNRQGSSGAAPIPQGRLPVYGASQAGALLQYRLATRSRHDPRLYLRGYRALIPGGESEAALGASVRPLPAVPVRVAAEARYTWFPTGSAVRPAALAITELPPIRLPLGTSLEAYGQAGWVGGKAETAFADGQATIMRDLPFVGRMSKDALKMSFGAGVWGGAQRGVERVDVGPSLRFDLKVGRIPTRVSVDWRHHVAGAAAPGSGIAATVTTGF